MVWCWISCSCIVCVVRLGWLVRMCFCLVVVCVKILFMVGWVFWMLRLLRLCGRCSLVFCWIVCWMG